MPTLTANRLLTVINRYGQEATLTKPAFSTYNPATGSVAVDTSVNYTVKAYFANYSLTEIDNDSVVMGDRKVLLPHVDTTGATLPEPDSGDTISGVGDAVKIVGVQKIYSGASLVCYICQVRE